MAFAVENTGCKDDVDNIISASNDVFHHPDAVEDDERHLRQTTTQMNIGSTTRQGCNEADVSSALNENCIGWTKSLKHFPPFTYEKLEHKLVKNSRTMPDNVAPKAFRNMKKGYGLWREGYVNRIFIKPNVQTTTTLCLAKARVSASMKSIQYNVYVHLCQQTGEVQYAKCSCVAGQGGCCKHVAALLYSLMDFVNLGLQNVPEELTCTQVAQKWSVPSNSNKTLKTAVKFDDLLFEKAEINKQCKRKKPRDIRNNYCAIPPFAKTTTKEEIQSMTDLFRKAERASLLCDAIESNKFEPCNLFETSCSRANKPRLGISTQDKIEAENRKLISAIFSKVPVDTYQNLTFTPEQERQIQNSVCLTTEQAKEICSTTMNQSADLRWYSERSKRITASVFGQVINRRLTIHPTSLIKSITQKKKHVTSQMPVQLQWGLNNEENATLKYKDQVENKENVVIKSCGLVVSPKWPWLGCSPDGVLLQCEECIGCLEIKCPYSKKDMTILEAVKSDKKFFLKSTTSGLELKRSHAYFYQCQGIVNILGLPWIDFVVYTNVDMYVERIYKDTNLWERTMLPKLTSFYLTFILPEV